MSSYSSAELQANNVIVRDFSSLGNEQHPVAPHMHTNPEQSPSKEGEEEEEEEEEGRENRSGFSTTNTTAETPSITTTDHHAKLPYTRFYSPKWTSQHQPPQDSMPPPPPIPSFHPSASHPLPPPILPARASFRMSRADIHRQSNESDSSYGSQYSTMPYEQHYRDKGSSTVPSRRASTRHRVSSGYLSDGSRYSTDVGGKVDTGWGRYRVRDEDRSGGRYDRDYRY